MAERPDGIYPGVPFAEYVQWSALNWGRIKHALRSLLHARHEDLHPRPTTPLQEFGQLAHAAILEPARFERDYIAWEHWTEADDEGRQALTAFREIRRSRIRAGDLKTASEQPDRNTREGKAFWSAFDAWNNGQRTVLDASDFGRIRGMIAVARADPFVSALLYGAGQSEVSLLWTDAETGKRCKARLDRLVKHAALGGAVYVDLKTTGDAGPEAFSRVAARLLYHGQAAFYGDGMTVLTKRPRRFVHVAIEADAPHGVAVYELGEREVGRGRALYRQALDAYARALAEDCWPGYPSGAPIPLGLPAWAMRDAAAEPRED